MGITLDDFYKWVEPMRDASIWENAGGTWKVRDSVVNHPLDESHEKARPPLSNDRTLSEANRRLYYNPDNPPAKTGDPRLDEPSLMFKVM
jgi:hypothetical protein